MITWMQKHKKWLVVTIWISTIAFVGAGFVGWGSYDFGKQSASVAVVGEREISVDEHQREYSALYRQYSSIFGEQFNDEMARTLKLSDAALRLAIQKNLILSYADSLGLGVTQKEVIKELLSMNAFFINGVFDKDTYVRVLSQNRTTPTVFEESIKRNILLQKVEQLFKVKSSDEQIERLSSLMFLEDEINIEVLNINNIAIDLDLKKVEEFWNKNKFDYLSAQAYDISITKTALLNNIYSDEKLEAEFEVTKYDFKKSDGKLKSFDEAKTDVIRALNVKATKKIALKNYLKAKKAKIDFEANVRVHEDSLDYSASNIKKLSDAAIGAYIKPFLNKNEYISIKMNKKIAPEPLSYEDAKGRVTPVYIQNEKNNLLKKLAIDRLKDFKGENIGYVSRNDVNKIKALNAQEARTFLSALFMQKNKEDIIDLGSKIVLYRINDSRLVKTNAQEQENVKNSIVSLLDNELMNNFVRELEKIYEVRSALDNTSAQ